MGTHVVIHIQQEHLQFRKAQESIHGVDIQETITSNDTLKKYRKLCSSE